MLSDVKLASIPNKKFSEDGDGDGAASPAVINRYSEDSEDDPIIFGKKSAREEKGDLRKGADGGFDFKKMLAAGKEEPEEKVNVSKPSEDEESDYSYEWGGDDSAEDNKAASPNPIEQEDDSQLKSKPILTQEL